MSLELESPTTTAVITNFWDNCEKYASDIACGYITEDSTDALTYSELEKEVRNYAGYLQKNLTKGDRVLIIAENSNEFVISFYACLISGITTVPCNTVTAKKAQRLNNIIEDCNAKMILGQSPALKKLKSFLDVDLPFISKEDVGSGHEYAPESLDENHVAYLQYTSGTTSSPKGVKVTFSCLLSNLKMIQKSFEFNEDTIVISWLPFYHDMGLVGMLLSHIYCGGTTYYFSPADFIKKPMIWLKALSDFKATATGAPNFAFEHCVKRVKAEDCETLDFSNLKTFFCGSEPIRYQSLNEFHQKFSKFNLRYNALYPCYGMAEVALFATGGIMGDPMIAQAFDKEALKINKIVPLQEGHKDAVVLVGCGFSTPGSGGKVTIVDPDRHVELENEVGEIWLSGPHLGGGYWNRPELTEEIFHAKLQGNPTTSHLRTGDLGFVYGGHLFICGRIKDLIIFNGRNIHPHDIEHSLNNSHESMKEGHCTAFSTMVDNREVLICLKEVHRHLYRQIDQLEKGQAPDSTGSKQLLNEIFRSAQKSISEDNGVLAHDIYLIAQGRLPVTSSGKKQVRVCKQMYENGEFDGFSLPELLKKNQ